MADCLVSPAVASQSHLDILWDVPVGGVAEPDAVPITIQLHRSIVEPIQAFARNNDVTLVELVSALAIRFSGELQEGGAA